MNAELVGLRPVPWAATHRPETPPRISGSASPTGRGSGGEGVTKGDPTAHLGHRPPCGRWRGWGQYLGALLVVVLLRADPAPHQVVAHRVSQREKIVAGGGHIAVLDQREVQVPVEALLQLRHVFHAHDAADADLPPLLLVSQGLGHGGGRWRSERDGRPEEAGSRTEEAPQLSSPLLLIWSRVRSPPLRTAPPLRQAPAGEAPVRSLPGLGVEK